MRIWKSARPTGGGAAQAVNLWLWPRLMPELCDRHGPELFLGCGPALSRREPALEHYARITVFGAGASGPEDLPDMTGADWDVRFVRGPETAALLGLPDSRRLSDPALLAADALPSAARRPRAARRSRRVAFMPGPVAAGSAALRLAAAAGLPLIQTEGRLESWLHQLLDCDALICAEPAAAAVADSLGIPWRPVIFAEEEDPGLDFEWRDFCFSLNLLPVALALRPPAPRRPGESIAGLLQDIVLRRAAAELRAAAQSDQWTLSDRAACRWMRQEMRERLEAVRDAAHRRPARPPRLRLVRQAAG